ncbi:MAG TPA: hypothetical protein VGJ04_01475 [Pirellulales bacterium]
MLRIRNMCCLIAIGLMLSLGGAKLQADSQRPIHVKNMSLTLNGDCCETAPAPAPACKTYKPCITYRGCCDCCGPKVSQVLQVKDPCDCCCNPCVAEIPVCLPACCKNPCVSCKCGLFGRGIVTYSYDCGCCVTVVFCNCGEVIVKYRG